MAPIVVNQLIEARADAFARAANQGADMRKIEFRVDNELPPKKGGATSMWGNPTEEPRLIALRKAARSAVGSQPFTKRIRLTLRLHVGEGFLRKGSADPANFGDLDNFIGGVCDGLQRPTSNTERFSSFCAIENDSQVVKIYAEKGVDLGFSCSYRIELEEVEGE